MLEMGLLPTVDSLLSKLRGRRVYFDTNTIIYFAEQNKEYYPVVLEVFKLIGTDGILAFTSEFTLAEILIKPFRERADWLVENIQTLLLSKEFFTLTPTSAKLFLKAAEVGGALGLRSADAIHWVSALENHCSYFLTNDARFRSTQSLEVLILKDFL